MIRQQKELNTLIAREVLGHEVFTKNKRLFEKTPGGERPLRTYDTEMNYAWEIAEKMNMALIPVQDEGWFAFVGPEQHRWQSPTELLEFLKEGSFKGCGAAVGKDPAKAICHAALNALDKRRTEAVPEAPPQELAH